MKEKNECSKCGLMNPQDAGSCIDCGNDTFKPSAENQKIFDECNKKLSRIM